ncbi:MAG: HIT family protein [Candidatus Altiarchaeales archaeon HGW-Altiarchaeales-2]|nr:MAG: HIT family protein [Candidatus Altiarchaeales archaeon HGW-Altiarchaeales-2]
MVEDECIFCKIVAGEIPSFKIYEDQNFVAFLDVFPVSEGHALIIPKTHYRWVWDLPNDLYAEYWIVAKKVAKFLQEKLSADFVQVYVEGSQISHAHIWLIPRVFGGSGINRMRFSSDEERMNFVKKAHEKIGILK